MKEGEPVKYVYIILNGEYEILRDLGKVEEEDRIRNEEDQVIRPLLAHEDAKRCQAVKRTKEWHNPSRVKRVVRLSIAGECKIIGENDLRFNRNSTVTVVGSSQRGTLYKIKASDFLYHLKNDEDAWIKFTQSCFEKEKNYGKRVHSYVSNVNKNKKILSHKQTNLLEKRNVNAEELGGEIDVRNSFDAAVKNIHSKPIASMVPKSQDNVISDIVLSKRSQKVTFRKSRSTNKRRTLNINTSTDRKSLIDQYREIESKVSTSPESKLVTHPTIFRSNSEIIHEESCLQEPICHEE